MALDDSAFLPVPREKMVVLSWAIGRSVLDQCRINQRTVCSGADAVAFLGSTSVGSEPNMLDVFSDMSYNR